MFEMMDLDSKNFMYNSGSYFILVAWLSLFYLIKFLINRVATY